MNSCVTEPDAAAARRPLFGAACIALQPILLNALSVPVMALIIRRLGAASYGQWALAASLVIAASSLVNLGLRGAFIRDLVHNPHRAADATAEQFGLRLTLSAVAGMAAIIACFLLGYSHTILICTVLASSGLLFAAISLTSSDLLQASHQLPLLAGVNFISGLTLTAASIVAVYFNTGPIGLTISYLLGPMTSAALCLRLIRRRLFAPRIGWDVRRFWRLIKDSRYFAAQQFVNATSYNAESLLVPKLVGVAPFGFFSAGTLLPERLAVVNDALCTAYYPVLAQTWQRDCRAASRQVMQCLGLVLLGCMPLVVLGLFFAEPIAHVLFPAQADVCRRIITITIWALPLMGVENMMGYALNAAGRDASQARLSALMGACTVILAVALILQWGVAGACWSWVLRHVVRASLRLPDFLRTFSPTPGDLPLGRIVACVATMAGLMWCINAAWPVSIGSGRLLLVAAMGGKAAVGLLAYGAALVALRIVKKSEVMFLLRRNPALRTRIHPNA